MNLTFDEYKNFEGYLMKKSPRFFFDVFQIRYFKILDGKFMIYMEYTKKKSMKQMNFHIIIMI